MCWIKEDFLANNMNKQALIKRIGCRVIHARGDADVDIAKEAVTISSCSSNTLIREDTDLLVLLLCYYEEQDSKELYCQSDKDKITPYVYTSKYWGNYWVMSFPIIYYLVMHFQAPTQHHGYLVGKKNIWRGLNIAFCYARSFDDVL